IQNHELPSAPDRHRLGWLSLRCCICDGEWAFRRDALSLGGVRHQDKTARRQGKKRATGYPCRLPGEVLASPVVAWLQRAFNMVAPLSRASPKNGNGHLVAMQKLGRLEKSNWRNASIAQTCTRQRS